MDSDPNIFFNWTTYTVAAKGYTKLDLLTKALEMLKKSDRLITGYLRNGQNLKAEGALKKEEVVSGRRWKPSNESLATCLEYLKEEEDLEGFHGAIKA
ncbi:hypothetical protein POTOM_023762 [Populus tomentosa]|uniref:Uncharacterized protein n=1 Tax=Populus tomentosa TaxID=118781 RepID=A0A8X8CZS4_POPTO|nr:hypothetical protein POTOM_023762 [Populus tomentosa]